MNHPRRSMLTPSILAVSLILVLLALSWSHRAPVAAQDDPTKYDAMPGLTETQKAFLRDQEPPRQAPALSAIPCVNGFADIYPCNNVDLLAFMPLATIGGGSGNDSWGWTDPLDGKEYALMGRTNGVAFVDITDPENPIYLGNLPTHNGISSSWRDIKVYANHAFVVADASSGHGMQVFDLTQLRSVVSPPVTFSNTAHYNGFGSAHNIVINEDSGYAYAVGTSTCSGGLHMIDISTPTSPTNAGCFSSDGYTHDAQCVNYIGPDPDHQGKEICFNSNEDTLTIVDVTNKAAPVQLSRTGYSGRGYTHQGWLTEDHQYFLLDDELDEQNFGHNTRTRIWDVRNLDAPTLIGTYDGPVPAIDHNLYIKDNVVYEANYRSGLRILDGADIPTGSLTEIAFFDTYPESDSASFSGAWSTYPYFASGTVIISDINRGLFIVRPNLAPDFLLTADTDTLAVCGSGADMATVTLTDRNGYVGNVTLSTSGLPAGSADSFSVNPVAVPGSSVLTVNVTSTAGGVYPFTLSGSDGTITHDQAMTLYVTGAAPVAPALLTPPDGATGQPPQPTFTWTAVAEAVTYEIQIATDAGFGNIVDSATGLSDTSYTPASGLPAGTTLYWRVRGTNDCGNGSYSATFSFTTLTCATPNLSIPDNNPTGATSDLILTGSGTIDDLDVSILVQHTWVGDLAFSLTHVDTGTSVTFFDRPGVPGSTFGCSGDDIDATLDDQAAVPVEGVCAPSTPTIQGTFQPNNPLAVFDGEPLAGTWRLTASDHAGGDTGTVLEWCVLADASSTYNASLSGPSTVNSLPGSSVTHEFVLTNSGLDDSYDLAVGGNAWPTTLLTSSPISLTSGMTATIEVMVDIPPLLRETIHDTDAFTLTVTSVNQPSLVLQTTGTTNSETLPGVALSGDSDLAGVAGGTITHTVTVTNTGNYTDAFTLLLGPFNWTTLAPATTGPMAPGQSTTLEVFVTVGAGLSDSVDVTFRSQLDTSVSATVTLTSRTYRLYQPIIWTP